MTIQVHVQYGRLSVKSEGVQNVPKIVVNMEHVMMESVDVPHNIVAQTVQKVSIFFLLMTMSLVVQPRELFRCALYIYLDQTSIKYKDTHFSTLVLQI